MNRLSALLLILLIGMTLTVSGIQDAEARRFGGGRSFGGKPSYSNPYRRSTAQPGRSASQQKAYQRNQTQKQSLARRGGFMGMLGGLALGGLLGALFFGGAFTGFNLLDIVVFGAIAYLLYQLFAAKSPAAQRSAYDRSGYHAADNDFSSARSDMQRCNRNYSAGFDTDVLFNQDKNTAYQHQSNALDANFDTLEAPPGFDPQNFLSGAKTAFEQLQTAWDNKDLHEMRGLTTDSMFAEIQQQLKEDNGDNVTEVLRIDAELLDIREINHSMEAVVLFDTILREHVAGHAVQVREIWHFVKPGNSIQPQWYLDGIQQMEK